MISRVELLAKAIPLGSFFAEVGSDHASISVLALKRDPKAQAQLIDNKKGPYGASLRAISENCLEGRAYATLANGLDELDPKVNCLVIAGMGGALVKDILAAHPEKLEKIETLILEPQGQTDILLAFLENSGFHHVDYKMTKEGRHFYECFILTKGVEKKLDAIEVNYGPLYHLEKELFIARESIRVSHIEAILSKNIDEVTRHKKQQELFLIKEALRRLER